MFLDEKKAGEQKVDAASKLLLDAADYIDVHGWCQNAPISAVGTVCAMGAMMKVLGFDYYDNPEYHEALKRMQICIGWNVPLWNDAPGMTKENVVATLRSVAAEGK
jgi:hypothetical protein